MTFSYLSLFKILAVTFHGTGQIGIIISTLHQTEYLDDLQISLLLLEITSKVHKKNNVKEYIFMCKKWKCCHPVVSDSLQPHGLSSARLLWLWDFPGKNTGVVAIPFSRGSSQPRDQRRVSCIAGRFFTIWATREAHFSYALHPKNYSNTLKDLLIATNHTDKTRLEIISLICFSQENTF